MQFTELLHETKVVYQKASALYWKIIIPQLRSIGDFIEHPGPKKALYLNKAYFSPLYSNKEPFYAGEGWFGVPPPPASPSGRGPQ